MIYDLVVFLGYKLIWAELDDYFKILFQCPLESRGSRCAYLFS